MIAQWRLNSYIPLLSIFQISVIPGKRLSDTPQTSSLLHQKSRKKISSLVSCRKICAIHIGNHCKSITKILRWILTWKPCERWWGRDTMGLRREKDRRKDLGKHVPSNGFSIALIPFHWGECCTKFTEARASLKSCVPPIKSILFQQDCCAKRIKEASILITNNLKLVRLV